MSSYEEMMKNRASEEAEMLRAMELQKKNPTDAVFHTKSNSQVAMENLVKDNEILKEKMSKMEKEIINIKKDLKRLYERSS